MPGLLHGSRGGPGRRVYQQTPGPRGSERAKLGARNPRRPARAAAAPAHVSHRDSDLKLTRGPRALPPGQFRSVWDQRGTDNEEMQKLVLNYKTLESAVEGVIDGRTNATPIENAVLPSRCFDLLPRHLP